MKRYRNGFLAKFLRNLAFIFYKPIYRFFLTDGVEIVFVKNIIPSWAFGQTIGNTIFFKKESLWESDFFKFQVVNIFPHEYIHVLQYRTYGDMFFVYYFVDSLIKALHGKNYYSDNKFEKEAREKSLNFSDNWDLKIELREKLSQFV